VTFVNNPSNAVQSAAVIVTNIEPQVTITKTLSASTADAGNVLTVTLTVTNSGLATAFDLSVTDLLNSAYFDPTTVANFTQNGGALNGFVSSVNGNLVTIQSDTNSYPPTNSLAPQQKIVFAFQVTTAQALPPNGSVTNVAGLVYDTINGPAAQQRIEPVATNSATLTTPNLTLGKALYGTSDTNSVGGNVEIGEVVTYRLTVGVPESTVTNLAVTDTLPLGLLYVTNRIDASSFNGNLPAAVVTGGATGGAPVTLTFPGNTVVTGGGTTTDHSFTIDLDAVVLNAAANKGLSGQQTTLTNTAAVTFVNNPSNAVQSAAVIVTNIEPQVTITKTLSASTADAGNVLTVTLTVTNSGLATAFDLSVTDLLNRVYFDSTTVANFTQNGGTLNGFVSSVDTGSGLVTIQSDTNSYPPTNSLAAQQRIVFTFQVTTAQALPPNGTVTNVAGVVYDTINGLAAQQRIEAAATSSAVLTTPNLTLGKAVFSTSETNAADSTGNNVQIGETITYRLAVTVPQGTVSNLTVTDTLPAGLAYIYGSAAVDSSAFAGSLGTLTESPTGTAGALAGNGQAMTFTFSGPTVCTGTEGTSGNSIAILVKALVLNVAGNHGLPGQQTIFANQASVTFPGNPSNAVFSGTVTNTAVEPRLAMTKSMTPAIVDAGDTLTITLTVTNSGLASAYDMALTDVLSPAGFDVTSAAPLSIPAGFLFTNSNGTVQIYSDSAAAQTNRTLAAGKTLTAVFTAKASAMVLPNATISNAASVLADTIDGVNADSTSDQQRAVSTNTTASTAGVYASSVSGYVYADSNNNGVKDGGEPAITNVTITLSGTDNLGGQVLRTTATLADGSYQFSGLRPGTYTLTSTQPSGWLDGKKTAGTPFGGTVNNTLDSQTIAGLVIPADANSTGTGYNFGELLPGSLAGRVYVDFNTNGVYDVGEPGISNVTVTLTGTDDRGNAVNVAVSTGTNGQYACANLRPGAYALAETQPAGYGEGALHLGSLGGTAGIDAFTGIVVTQGSAGTNYDFGETMARIGDFVWQDLNGNGVQDAGELGISNVTVRLLDASSNLLTTATTDAQGHYAFSNLLAATYLVEFVAPTGMTFTAQGQGTNNLLDSDADVQTGRTAPFALAAGASDLSRDAGLYWPAQLGNFTWVDANANGQQDAGETGLVNVVVQLFDTNNTVIATTTSSVAGAYAFTNLTPGTYTVGFTPSAGWLFTTSNVGTAATDSKPLSGTNRTAVLTLISGQTNNAIDAGFYQVAGVAGAVFVDVNGNGIAEAADTNGIPGVTVQLLNASSSVVATVTTPASGAYSFANLTPGVYTVVQVLPSGYTNTLDTAAPNDLRIPVTLTSGQSSIGDNFYDTQYASVGGFVRVDVNGNGVVDAEDTNGLAGVTVQLLGAASNVVAATTTAANGAYSFANVYPGSYTVRETDLTGWYSTTQTGGGTNNLIPVTLTSGQSSIGNNFYDTQYTSIGGFVRVDVNGNGVVDAVDTNGIFGVTMQLLDAASNVVATTTTAMNGSYSFASVPAAAYTVRETDLAGWYSTTQTGGGSNNLIPVTLASGQSSTGNNFYDTAYVTIGDFTWVDTNVNGQQDSGEPGLQNVVARLYDSNNTVVATTTSSVAGAYAFAHVAAGTYTVGFTPPDGWLFTTSNVGNAATDSKPLSGTNRTAAITLSNGQTNNNVDAGFYQLAGVAGAVFLDLNGNGVADGNDTTGISGVTIRLLDVLSNTVATTTTGATGAYSFTNLTPASYMIVQTLLSGYTNTLDTVPPNDLRIPVTITSGQSSTGNNFYDAQYASIGGFVRVDVNGDGVVDAEDTNGLAGVTVQLLGATNNVLAATTTAANGAYSFANNYPGSYTIREIDRAGWYSTTQTGGGTNNLISVTLVSGQPSADNNFYDTAYASVGDFVWLDVNGNGLQDAGEPGISNVTVRLLDATSNILHTAITATNGTYSFTNLLAGTYLLQLVAPSNLAFTVLNAGTNTAIDSDAIPATGLTAPFTLMSGQYDSTRDAGLYLPATVYGFTFQDQDFDMVYNPYLDNPISGMTVTLWRAGAQIAATTSGGSGLCEYVFTNIPPGNYEVWFAGNTNLLEAMPTSGAAASNPERNRAVLSQGSCMATVTVASGDGVLTGQGQPVNAGFTPPAGPLSASVGICAYTTADGTVVEFATTGEGDSGTLYLYVLGQDGWQCVGFVSAGPVYGNYTYQFLVPGLAAGQSYIFQVVDEVGNVYTLENVLVTPFAANMVQMNRTGLVLQWSSVIGGTYEVYSADQLGSDWNFVAAVLATDTNTQVTIPVDPAKPTGFFKIVKIINP